MPRWTKGVTNERTSQAFKFLFGIALLTLSIAVLWAYARGELFLFFSSFVIEILLFLLGLFFIREGLMMKEKHLLSVVIGFFVGLFGVVPVLVEENLLDFLPFRVELVVSPFLLALLLFFSATYFLVDLCFHIFGKA